MAQKISLTLALLAMNHEKYIEQACKSILEQTYKDFDIIFLDNNSTDRTFEIADEIFKKAGVKYKGYKNDVNRTVSQNLNILVEKAQGEYITFLSGDDWYTPDNLEKKINFMLDTKSDVVFTDGYRYIQSTNEVTDLYTKENKKRVISLDNYFWDAITNNFLYAIGFITKREILLENRFDETVTMEDWDICLRFSAQGYKMGFLDEKLFYYRVLSSSLSNNSEVMERDFPIFMEKYKDLIIQRPKIYKKYLVKHYRQKYKEIEKKTDKTRADLLEYARSKKGYALAKYNPVKRLVVAAYWSIKIKQLLSRGN